MSELLQVLPIIAASAVAHGVVYTLAVILDRRP